MHDRFGSWSSICVLISLDFVHTSVNWSNADSISTLIYSTHGYVYFINYIVGIIPGAAEEATSVFSEGASLCIEKQYMHDELSSKSLQASSEDHIVVPNRSLGVEDVSPRQLKDMHGYDVRDISRNYHGAASNQPLNGGPASFSFYNTPSPMATQSQVCLCIVSFFELTHCWGHS